MCWIRGGSTIESNMFRSPRRAGISHLCYHHILIYYGYYALEFQLNQALNRAKKIREFIKKKIFSSIFKNSHYTFEHDILKDKSVGLTIAFPPIQNISKGRGHG